MNLPLLASQMGLPRNGLIALYDAGRQIALGTTGQTVTDFSGHGNTSQLGSTSESDTNDPAWSGTGWSFGTDDYIKLPTLSDISLTNNYSAVFVFNTGTIGTKRCIWSKGDANGRQGLFINAAGYLGYEKYTSSYSGVQTNDTLLANTDYIVSLSCNAGVLSMHVNGVPKTTSGTIALTSPASGHWLGYSSNGSVYGNTITTRIAVFYKQIFNTSQHQRIYNYLKRLMNSRGVTIT